MGATEAPCLGSDRSTQQSLVGTLQAPASHLSLLQCPSIVSYTQSMAYDIWPMSWQYTDWGAFLHCTATADNLHMSSYHGQQGIYYCSCKQNDKQTCCW